MQIVPAGVLVVGDEGIGSYLSENVADNGRCGRGKVPESLTLGNLGKEFTG